MKKPYVTLTFYHPDQMKAWIVGRDLTAYTARIGLEPLPGTDKIKQNLGAAWYRADRHAEARLTAVPGSEGTGWHQDGDTSPGANMDHALAVWADREPTQLHWNVRHRGEEVYQPSPFELILFRNLSCFHRRPPEASGFRMSFRQRVKIPSHIALP